MAPRKFQKVEVAQSAPAATTKLDHSDKPVEPNYGERNIFNCGIPYDGVRGSVNATVNPAELQRGIAKQKQAIVDTVAQHEEYRRVPKGERTITHKGHEETDTTTTTRLEH